MHGRQAFRVCYVVNTALDAGFLCCPVTEPSASLCVAVGKAAVFSVI
jgi:hypothetical protein